MIKVAIIGASGYTAWETIKILLRHNQAQLTYLTALPEECGPVTEIFPALRGRLDLNIEPVDLNKLSDSADVALCCLPHKVSMDYVPQLLSAGVKVVDFSADYRIHDAELYERVYQVPHTDQANLPRAVFGLPELFRKNIIGADLVANPGCYPTAASLVLAPLLKEKIIAPDDIIINAISGASGAGRKAALPFHFPEMNENLFAYAVGSHRHMPEINQILADFTGTPADVLFQPHVVSIDRGITETIYCRPLMNIDQQKLSDLYHHYYGDEPFVRILNTPPKLKDIANTNFVDIFATVTGGKVVVFTTIDNLVKGAAGQAVQNMNIISELPETEGLLS
ncbi:MAG: N-acetyl-gamma-glutamyl-phosphate reductase [Sedimentisphaerales bacterium]|nr:N-acetyl-gamma-glutamyl-phosphate reductase [Sedimentisphaerales bacterium]